MISPTSTRRILLAAVAILIPILTGPVPSRAADPIPVVATFSILGDLVGRVGGERVRVTTLIGPERDAHGFEPAPADAGRVAAARIVVANGLGFDGWIDRLLKASGGKAALVVASKGVKPIAETGGHGHGHSHATDPHAFQNVGNVKLYVRAIRDGLAAADPDGKDVFEANAKAYEAELDGLDAEVRAAVASIPADRRRVITSHDAFGYFAATYGIRFAAPRGVSTDENISARDVARIVRQIKAEKVPAVFLENVADPRLMEQIARESGAKVGGKLFSDALSDRSGPAPDYLALMRHNVRTLAAALTP